MRCLLGQEARRRQREVQKPVPVGLYLLGHRLLVCAVFARHPRRLFVSRPLGQALQELVGGYLHVLGHEAIAGVLGVLVGTGHVAHALEEPAPNPPTSLIVEVPAPSASSRSRSLRSCSSVWRLWSSSNFLILGSSVEEIIESSIVETFRSIAWASST